jgi:hypothetical protein
VFGAFPTYLADAAEEGHNMTLGMLVVGLIFIGVIALGELSKWAGHRRKARRPRPY